MRQLLCRLPLGEVGLCIRISGNDQFDRSLLDAGADGEKNALLLRAAQPFQKRKSPVDCAPFPILTNCSAAHCFRFYRRTDWFLLCETWTQAKLFVHVCILGPANRQKAVLHVDLDANKGDVLFPWLFSVSPPVSRDRRRQNGNF